MATPVVALDHLYIATPELAAARDDYAGLFGRAPIFVGVTGGFRTAVFTTSNTHVVLIEDEPGPPGLRAACFRVDDEQRLRRRLERLALPLEESADGDPLAALRGHEPRPLQRLVGPAGRGLGLSFIAADAARAAGDSGTGTAEGACVTGLDHIVIASGDALGTAFLFGAQLGLDLRMDRSSPDWGARLLFFRCGDLIVEVLFSLDGPAARPAATGKDGPDHFWGLSWRVADADKARDRLAAEDYDVSAVRRGRKSGTRVFTLRNRTAGVATLLLEPPRRP